MKQRVAKGLSACSRTRKRPTFTFPSGKAAASSRGTRRTDFMVVELHASRSASKTAHEGERKGVARVRFERVGETV